MIGSRSGDRGTIWAIVPLALIVTALLGCGGDPAPVGRLAIEPGVIELGYPHLRQLELRFEPTAELEGLKGPLYAFVHVLDRPGHVLRTFDQPLPRPWQPGEPIEHEIDLYQSALGEALPPGSYMLTFGLYDAGSGQRWHLETAGEEIARAEYRLGTLKVPESGKNGNGPRPRFTGWWQPPLAGTDLQILGQRCLIGSSRVELGQVGEPGQALLSLWLPEWAETVSGDKLSVSLQCQASNGAEAAEEPDRAAEVAEMSDTTVIRGAGHHRLLVPVNQQHVGQTCTIQLEPELVAPVGVEPDAPLACLQIFAWQALTETDGVDAGPAMSTEVAAAAGAAS